MQSPRFHREPPADMIDCNITPEEFRRGCGFWATGVSIVTTADASGRPFGLTMNAVTSLSLNPPMFVVCVDNGSDTLHPMRERGIFCVNVLARGQEALSSRFAKKGGDKFDGVEWSAGVTGAPVLAGTLAAVECAVSTIVPGGDHQIVCGEVRRMIVNDAPGVEPLLYFCGRYGRLQQE
jgi:flavin reductase (DIM6/NTAB) family NADH-FMN oxidoreductase RutF